MTDRALLKNLNREREKTAALINDLSKFKMAVDNVSDQIVITDSEGIVLYGNNAMEKTTGYKVEEALGKKAGTLWKTPMPREYYVHMWNVIKKEKKTFIDEVQNRRKEGTLYTAKIAISPVVDEKGNVLYFVGIERDVTQEREIDKAKTEFVSLASHQLRTPLSAINWYTEMLLAGDAGKLTVKQQKYLTEVYAGNQRMVALVNALLNVSRLDLGTFIIEPVSTDVVELIQSVLGELGSEIKKRKLNVSTSFGVLPDPFLADQKLFRMVIQNLLSNAVKYTSTKGTITIVVGTYSKGGTLGGRIIDEDGLAVSVADSGVGIPAGEQDKIFSKLFRASNAQESETEGTGLGLYVVKSIVDESGGKVWFTSEEKKGSTFYVAFPVSGMKKKEGAKKLD
jgi:PAS domain S-box-containing protein